MGHDVVADLVNASLDKRLIVFDYDGTLARLAINWDDLRLDLQRVAMQYGFHGTFRPLWNDMQRFRDCYGRRELAVLFSVLERYEDPGVDGQEPVGLTISFIRALRSADSRQRPVLGVFSANLHTTVNRGLMDLGVRGLFTHIIGADDVHAWKPAPEGLIRIRECVGAQPGQTLFIGDSDHDQQAARASSVAFWRIGPGGAVSTGS